MTRLLPLMLLLATAAFSCKSPTDARGGNGPDMAESPGEPTPVEPGEESGEESVEAPSAATWPQTMPVFTMKRHPCFGTCPVYTLTIWEDGTVRYEGARFVAREGTWKARLASGRVESIGVEAERIGYFSLADSYPTGDLRIMDLPTTITTLRWRGRTKTVSNGNYANPDVAGEMETVRRLAGFEDFVDDLVEGLDYEKVGDGSVE